MDLGTEPDRLKRGGHFTADNHFEGLVQAGKECVGYVRRIPRFAEGILSSGVSSPFLRPQIQHGARHHVYGLLS